MRYFEYVDESSSKFWEIDRDGSMVTVRFGRIGTTGQTQTKDLASDAAATAHVDKLIAEKTKKGYVEGGSSPAAVTASPSISSSSSPPPPVVPTEPAAVAAPLPTTPAPAVSARVDDAVDEDEWVVPNAWWRQAVPFRGLGPPRAVTADPTAPTAAAQLSEQHGAKIEQIWNHPGSDRDLVEAARLHLGKSTGLLRRTRRESTALGAAVVASSLCAVTPWQDRDALLAIVDDWFVTHGVVFGAEAAALLAGVWVHDPSSPHITYGQQNAAVTWSAPGVVNTYSALPLITRARVLLASASDSDYDAAVRQLDSVRRHGFAVRMATSMLAPTQQHWLDDDLAHLATTGVNARTISPLLASARTLAQADAIVPNGNSWSMSGQSELLFSAAAHIGPASAPFFVRLFDSLDAATKKRVMSIVGQFPTDEAFGLLLDRSAEKYVQPVLLEAMSRFPQRAMRMLADAAAGTTKQATAARDLLRGHVISNPESVELVAARTNAAAAALLRTMSDTSASAPVASTEQVPAILVSPPWLDRRAQPKPVVIEGLERPRPTKVSWKPGEQAEWSRTDLGYGAYLERTTDWTELVDKAVAGREYRQAAIVALAPEKLIRPRLGSITATSGYDVERALRRVLSRYGDDALPYVVSAVLTQPTTLAAVLLPVDGPDATRRMADWYVGSKSLRTLALKWLDRHAQSATLDLIPLALGKPGKSRSTAQAVLRAIAHQGHRDTVRMVAATYGADAAAAIDAALDADPLQLLPARIPSLPAWLDPAHLPFVALRDTSSVLPLTAVQHLCTMLAMSRMDDAYAGVEVARNALDPRSLADMAWGIFERWRGAGYPSKDSWVIDALGLVGDDETVRRLTPMIKAWPGEAAHSRAVTALDVLSAIGSDVALMNLHGIAEKAKFKGLKTKAKSKIDEVADALGLTADQLADRLVPDFGLDVDGSMLLDYGPRRFRVGFDEQLRPTVAEEDGTARKTLPPPSAKDDASAAPAAYAQFSGLKKDVRTIATDQIRRFEQAMVKGRRWTAREQRTLFIEHPLLWHLARRLVWTSFDSSDAPMQSFRVAEDRTLADSDDAEASVADDAVVGIAHPLHLGDSLRAWSDLFADYEILQPFPQLARETYSLTDDERTQKQLARFTGRTVPTGKILGLSHRGWLRGAPQDAGIQHGTYKSIAGDRCVVIDLDPGIIAGSAMEWAEQKIAGVWLNNEPSADWGNSTGVLPFGVLDAITASEMLRDLAWLRS